MRDLPLTEEEGAANGGGAMTAPQPGAHTPEPWAIANGVAPDTAIRADHGEARRRICSTVVAYKDGDDLAEDQANTRRIVACVNACEGISTSALERAPHAIPDLAALTRQRDELLTASEALVVIVLDSGPHTGTRVEAKLWAERAVNAAKYLQEVSSRVRGEAVPQ